MQTEMLRTSAWTGEIEGVPVILLRPDWGVSSLFRGGAIYGGSHSELEAYLYFSRWAHAESVVRYRLLGRGSSLEHESITMRGLTSVHHNRGDVMPLVRGPKSESQGHSCAPVLLALL